MQIKLETTPAYSPLDVGDLLFGFSIVATSPDSPQFIIDVPDEQGVERLAVLHAAGEVVDYREAHADYRPLGFPVVLPFDQVPAVGDQFPLVMADDCPARGRWGARPTQLGILDTGVDAGHVAFDGKDVRGDLRDGHGHGSHVASTAASAWGVASGSAILMLNVLPGGTGSEAGVANGFRALADAGCDVISASLGGSPSQVLDAAVEYARARGCLVVCAAGNNGDADPYPGSPARAATVSVYAVGREGTTPDFTDGKAWATCGSQGVAIAAAAAGTRSGVRVMSGTSMACPHVAGLLCLLRGAGMNPASCLAYLATHGMAVAGCRGGRIVLAADFGALPPVEPPGDEMDTAAITERVDAIRAAVQAAQAHRCAYGATKATYQASMATVMDEDIGPLDDLAREIGELANAPKAPDPGPEEPPPAPWRMPNGFTAPTHWDGDATKLDWYPGPLGTGIAWPLGGTVTVERGPSPGGTPIEWANYWADNGKRYRMGHVLRDVRTGRVEAHRVFAAVGDTGIEMLPDAAHIHLEVYDTQGRALPVLAELHALGFRPALVDRVPSPDEYLAGKARAGRFV